METKKRKKLLEKKAEPCCRVEAMVGVDERGQMILPKDVREKAGIHAGAKLAVVAWQGEGEVSCLVLMKTDKLRTPLRDLIGFPPEY